MLKCLEAAHICITVTAAKLLKGQLAEATHPTFSFLLLLAIKKITKPEIHAREG